jgi:hypothetical protein
MSIEPNEDDFICTIHDYSCKIHHETIYEINMDDITENFKTKGYIQIWDNIFESIALGNVNLTLEYIFTANQSRFALSNSYVLPIPPNDYEKFLYLNNGSYSYLIISIFSSISIIIGYIFLSISTPFYIFIFLILGHYVYIIL